MMRKRRLLQSHLFAGRQSERVYRTQTKSVTGCIQTMKHKKPVRPIHDFGTVNPSDTTVTFDEDYDVYGDTEDPKLTKTPVTPSQQEVEDHNVNHLPFRSWCKHCVRGKSKAHPHRVNENRISEVPIVSIDYMFMSQNRLNMRKKECQIWC